jgi:hypothetical protein
MKLIRSDLALLKGLAGQGFSVVATVSVAPRFAGDTPAATEPNQSFSTKLSHFINGRDRPPGERGRFARCVTRLVGHFGKLFGGGAEKGGRGARAPRHALRKLRILDL